jgi:hypothetical protein
MIVGLGPASRAVISHAAASGSTGAAVVGRTAVRSSDPIDVNGFLNGEAGYEVQWRVDSTEGWSNETSGLLERFATLGTHLECHAGGDAADTHYARVRRKLPERDDFAIRNGFSIEIDFELPADFYDRSLSYLRVMTVENTRGTYRSSGHTVGTSSSDEWRVGFAIYGGDRLFRLISDHQNHDKIILWTAPARLPIGRHVVRVDFKPSLGGDGAWALYVDGEPVGGDTGVQTVPSSVAHDDVVVTRVGGCIDGGSGLDVESVQVNLSSLTLRADS